MEAFWALFDAVVPILATASAIGVSSISLIEAWSWSVTGTGSLSHVPYVMMAMSASGWIVYACVSHVWSILVSNLFGLGCALYLVWSFFSHSRSLSPNARLHLAAVGAYAAVLALAAFAGVVSADTLGLLCSVVVVFMFASPLATLQLVLAKRSSESLPRRMIFMGLTCTSLWTLYGLRVGNVFMWGPNSLAMLLGLAQVALIIMFPTTSLLPGA